MVGDFGVFFLHVVITFIFLRVFVATIVVFTFSVKNVIYRCPSIGNFEKSIPLPRCVILDGFHLVMYGQLSAFRARDDIYLRLCGVLDNLELSETLLAQGMLARQANTTVYSLISMLESAS